MFLTYGNTYSFGLFFSALLYEFDANRADTAFVFSIIGGLYSTFGIISGPAADKYGTRPVCLFGILAMGAGLFYASEAAALWQVYLGFGLGLAFGMGSIFAPVNAGLQRWFTKSRGLASGFASAGIGLSIIVMPTVVANFIDSYNWRVAMQINGAIVLLVGVLATLFMGDPHGATGYINKKANSSNDTTPTKATILKFDLRMALTSRGYAIFFVSSTMCSFSFFLPFVHLIPYSIDHGLGEKLGVYFLSVIGVSSLIGRLILSAASDYLGHRNTLILMYITMGVSFALWWVGGQVFLLTLFAIFFGLGSGGYVAIIAPLLAEYFGTEKIGSMLGYFMPSIAIGGFFGPFLAGYSFDIWNDYQLPIAISSCFCFIAAVLGIFIPAQLYTDEKFRKYQ